MENKGIDPRSANILPVFFLRNQRRRRPALKPVEKSGKTRLWLDNQHQKRAELHIDMSDTRASEEDAKLAVDILTDYLKDNRELETIWRYDPELEDLVVEIRSKVNGQVIEQLSSGDIILLNRTWAINSGISLLDTVA